MWLGQGQQQEELLDKRKNATESLLTVVRKTLFRVQQESVEIEPGMM